jgi:hypothetical protein
MQRGVHLVERARLPSLAAHGVSVPEPWMGLLDVLRMVEGHYPEPPEAKPLGLVGLDALLRATPGDGAGVMLAIRGGLADARSYFAWKQIPLVILVDGQIEDLGEGVGQRLVGGERRWSLTPLLGSGLTPGRPGVLGWWWASQLA